MRKRKEIIKTKKDEKLIRMRKGSNMSAGELLIANFLKDNLIDFIPEFYFKEMSRKGIFKALFFDFYLPKYNLAIEYDGEQHYTKIFNGKKLLNQEENDFIKSAFCKKNKITLLRIKYTDINNIESILCKKFDEIN